MGRVRIDKLEPGMILAADVYTSSDQLILPEGLELNKKTIEKLEYYGVDMVRVLDEIDEDLSPDAENISYGERISSTKQFKEYKKTFEDTIGEMSRVFSDVVVKNVPLDTNSLVDSAFKLLNSAGEGINIFGMLHNMRTYDDLTFAHSLNVGLICNVFAGWLGMSEEERRIATECGILHDIGKMKMPSEIIKKPTSLTNEEYEIIKNHPSEGYKILQKCGAREEAKRAALMHHERYDGTGYPMGLEGEQIDKFARMVSIVDVYEAMTAERVYRGPNCPFRVVADFEKEGLQKYDTHMIMVFLENIVNTYMLNRVRLSNGKEGDIIFINKQCLSRPVVKCGDEYIDLSKEKDIKIDTLL